MPVPRSRGMLGSNKDKKLSARRQGWRNILDDNNEIDEAKVKSARILRALVAGKSGGILKLRDLELSEVRRSYQ